MRSLPGGLSRWAGTSLLVVAGANMPYAQDVWTVTDSGRPASACSQLSDFLAEVSRKVLDGALTPAEGAALSEAATGIRSALGC